MGGRISRFTQEELSIYESCTCLDGAELATIYEKFIKMGGRRVPKGADEASYRWVVGQNTVRNMTVTQTADPSQVETSTDDAADSNRRSQAHKATKAQKVPKAKVCDLPEFDNNPFAPRLCEVFSSDGSGDLHFDELLDMFHALSPKAEREVKILTAFRVYDFDGDGYLNAEDISTLIRTTTVVMKKNNGSIAESHVAGGHAADLEDGGPKEKRALTKDVLADIVDTIMRECDLDGRGRLSFHEFKRVMDRFPDVEAKLSVQLQ